MTLQMFIHDILIDKSEVDYQFCQTLEDRDQAVEETRHYLSTKHFGKSFVSHQDPVFVLVVESRANHIIKADIFRNKLVLELENELKNKIAVAF